jgi:uncharacterized protein (DUF305 family)
MYQPNNRINTSATTRRLLSVVAFTAAALTAPTAVQAQSSPTMPPAAAMTGGKPSMAIDKAADNMDKKMAAMAKTGNPDIDFAMMMVIHHQGAIDMAQAEVDGGKDAAMIKAAKKIIVAQKKEIAQFEVWLKKNPHPMK